MYVEPRCDRAGDALGLDCLHGHLGLQGLLVDLVRLGYLFSFFFDGATTPEWVNLLPNPRGPCSEIMKIIAQDRA